MSYKKVKVMVTNNPSVFPTNEALIEEIEEFEKRAKAEDNKEVLQLTKNIKEILFGGE